MCYSFLYYTVSVHLLCPVAQPLKEQFRAFSSIVPASCELVVSCWSVTHVQLTPVCGAVCQASCLDVANLFQFCPLPHVSSHQEAHSHLCYLVVVELLLQEFLAVIVMMMLKVIVLCKQKRQYQRYAGLCTYSITTILAHLHTNMR